MGAGAVPDVAEAGVPARGGRAGTHREEALHQVKRLASRARYTPSCRPKPAPTLAVGGGATGLAASGDAAASAGRRG